MSECPTCHKTFSSEQQLEIHISREHGKARWFGGRRTIKTPTQRRAVAPSGERDAELLGLVERLLAEQRKTNELLEKMLNR